MYSFTNLTEFIKHEKKAHVPEKAHNLTGRQMNDFYQCDTVYHRGRSTILTRSLHGEVKKELTKEQS